MEQLSWQAQGGDRAKVALDRQFFLWFQLLSSSLCVIIDLHGGNTLFP
ncbi:MULTISPECIES: hypothetical protein [unclassified Microcoleus]